MSKKSIKKRSVIFLASLIMVVSLSPFSATAQDGEASDSAASATQENRPAAEGGESAEQEAASPGMSFPFDGSSVEAFEESLAAIKAEVTDLEYSTLTNALDYLLVYDLGARRNKEVLYQRLDGKTPNDVLKMVKWRGKGTGRIRGHDSRTADT